MLAAQLKDFAGRSDTVVLALPRGGVPVGYEIARALHLPLDVLVIRKLGVPEQPELALGAIASGGTLVLNEEVVQAFGLSREAIQAVAASEQSELERREREYRSDQPQLILAGHNALLVDDGLATGSSMRVAVKALRIQGLASIIVAVPVAAEAGLDILSREADGIVCLNRPINFYAVGSWYRDFEQTSDAEVRALLRRAHKNFAGASR
jgi:putative phosphoribosyl transferase